MRVRVHEPVGQPGADGRVREEGREGGDEEVGEFAEGAGGPGVDLEVGREVGRGCCCCCCCGVVGGGWEVAQAVVGVLVGCGARRWG